jgi:malate dehydrogenase (oxaloacetate-decarboxylating)(NADP+)
MNVPTVIITSAPEHLTGYDRLHNSRLNKGTAFTETERRAFGKWH